MLEKDETRDTYICCNNPNIFWSVCCCHCNDDNDDNDVNDEDNEINCCNKPYVWIHFGLIILIILLIIFLSLIKF